MEALNKFIQIFCDLSLDNVHKVGRRYYQVNPELWKTKESIDRDVYALGIFLGEFNKVFKPSFELLDMIGKKTTKKMAINAKGEWLFVCKKDVFPENFLKPTNQGLYIVQNAKKETLGYGKVKKHKNKLLLSPILDRGNFLRRE